MGFAAYLRQSLWDFILCVCAASSLCYVCLIAFQATSPLQGNIPLIVGVCAAILLVFFAIAQRPMTAAIGSAVLVVAFCAAVVGAWRASGAESLFSDGQGNYVYAVVLFALCSVLTFVLSRWKVPAVVLLAGGLVLCAAMEYLYWQGKVLAVALFGVSAAALIAYRSYQSGLRGSQTEDVSFSATAITALLIAALGAGLSCGVFALAVAPLNPPNVTIKLITKHVRVQEEHLRGVGDTLSVENKELFSTNTNTEQQNADGEQGQLKQQENMDDTQKTDSDQSTPNAGSALGLDSSADNDAGTATSMHVPDWLPFVAGLLALLLVAAVIGIRKVLRRRWLTHLRRKSPAAQVEGLYLYFLRGFGRMGVPLPACQTIGEHARDIEAQSMNFEQVQSDPVFTQLAQEYAAVVYGSHEPGDETLGLFYDYYAAFHKRAVRFAGRLKYLYLFFRM